MQPRLLLVPIAAALLSFPLPAQQPTPLPAADGTSAAAPVQRHGLPGALAGTERWLVTFKTRSFDLEPLRLAIWNDRPVDERKAIVARYEQQMRADQAPFVEAVERLGGRVTDQWWIVNGCAIEIAPAHLAAIRAMAQVDRLDPDELAYAQILKATNSANHNSDAVNANGHKGLGVVTAIVDTGQDENRGGSGLPHQTYYPEGDKTKTSRLVVNRKIGAQPADDVNGHGTGVAGIVAGGKWSNAGADHGHAPLADIAGYAIADQTNSGSSYTTIVNAWNAVLNDKATSTYKIVSANNSYSGTPDPLHASQQALDACALTGDILVVVAAGNNSSSTASSQSCANGLAVAALNADTHTVATFSSRGPLSGDTTRFYPDIAGCGVNTVMPARDNETGNYVASGTSMASPQVCGAGTLLRGTVTTLRADETKAILLASALDISAKNPTAPYNSRNAYGMGLSKDDAAMTLAQDASKHGRATLTTAAPVFTQPVVLTSGKTYRFAIAWMRQVMTQKTWADLTLEILDGATVVASSTTPRNLYELAALRASRSGVFILRVTATAFETTTTKQEFGWAWTEGIAPPVVGSYTAYGAGCKGSGTGGGGPVCASANATQTANKTTTFVTGALFAHEVTAPTNLIVTGFELLCRTTAAVSVTTEVYLSGGTTPATTPVRSGTMAVGTASAFYATTFAPLPVTSGQKFYITYRTPSGTTFYPEAAGGTPTTYFWNGPSWSGPWTQRPFAWRVNCQGTTTGAVPVLSSLSIPEIAKPVKIDLAFARKSAGAALILGGSKTKWLALNLPFDLTPYGGTGCSVLASLDVLLPVATDATGNASVTLGIPNDKALIQVGFYNQYLILDPANTLGLVLSNGGEAKIGGQP